MFACLYKALTSSGSKKSWRRLVSIFQEYACLSKQVWIINHRLFASFFFSRQGGLLVPSHISKIPHLPSLITRRSSHRRLSLAKQI